MSKLERLTLLAMTLGTGFVYFVPELWNGLFDANTSYVAKLYGFGLFLVIANVSVWGIFVYLLITDFIKKHK